MFEYHEVYDFEVISKLMNAVNVRCVDKLTATIYKLEEMFVLEVAELINTSKNEKGRMYFYTTEEKKDV